MKTKITARTAKTGKSKAPKGEHLISLTTEELTAIQLLLLGVVNSCSYSARGHGVEAIPQTIEAWREERPSFVKNSMSSPFNPISKDEAIDEMEYVDTHVSILEKISSRSTCVAVTPSAEQLDRLKGGASFFKCTPEELCLAGALSSLDLWSMSKEDAIPMMRDVLSAYARKRLAFMHPKDGTSQPVQLWETRPPSRGKGHQAA